MVQDVAEAISEKAAEIDLSGFVSKGLVILVVIIASAIVIKVGNFLIKRFILNKSRGKNMPLEERRVKTLASILRSVIRYAVYFIAGMTILDTLGVPMTSIVATAGIGGLAVGFGAQNLIKDIITGFFLLLEDQISIGDYVTIEGISGTVVGIGMRVTTIQGIAGELNIIPNGSISKVINYSKANSNAIVDVSISYDSDINKAAEVMKRVGRELMKDDEDVVEQPEVLGVVSLGDSCIRMMATVRPATQWAVERELRKRIKDAFQREGIKTPYPRTVVIRQEA